MADIKPGAKYILTNSLIGPKNGLASTSANDSVVIGPSNPDGSQEWYFRETSTSGYYRFYTQQKGDSVALDVFNYLHMYFVQENTGQRWRFNKQGDGSFRINNQFTGPDMYLDVVKDTLQPTLAANDGPGQRWTLSQVVSTPTATSSGFKTMSTSVSSITTVPTNTSTTNPSPSKSAGLSTGAIVGIAIGCAGLFAVVIAAFVIWKKRKSRHGAVIQNPPAITSRPMLHVPEAGRR
ncbi:hypothetical protein GQ44DRAFT_825224 [Phaeosphaeriaceae sp. PMI808]|nr:hypothetical protein GQ44DRAFT_825224 [Phaeosphaeriaceae sp. PMI808]